MEAPEWAPSGPRRAGFGRRKAPRSWVEKANPNLIYFNQVGKGNHFAAWQEPEIFTTEVRAGFRSLRQEGSTS